MAEVRAGAVADGQIQLHIYGGKRHCGAEAIPKGGGLGCHG